MTTARSRTIALAVGGTAGHVYPAVAVAAELRDAGFEVVFFGARRSIASKIVPHDGFEFVPIAGAPYERTGMAGKLTALTTLPFGFVQARAEIRRRGIAGVIGFGGYPTVAPLVAARSAGIWTAVHEANAQFGRANALLAGHVDRIFAAVDGVHEAAVVVGVPVRRAIRRVAAEARRPPDGCATILVMSGTEPAPFLNAHVPSLLTSVRGPLRVIHQTAGSGDEDVRARYAAASIDADVAPYFEAIEDAYARADLAITRAGASTVAEVALCAIPAILVPNPTVAADHQTRNVRRFEEIGGTHWFAEARWDERAVGATVEQLLHDEGSWCDASTRIRLLARGDAAERIAGTVVAEVAR